MARSTPEERVRRGRYLRAARERAGKSQDDIAYLLGYAKGGIVAHWERGRQDPSVVNLRRMAEIYGVPVSLFIDPPPSELDVIEDAVLRAEREAVARALGEDEPTEPARRYVRRWAEAAAPPKLRRVDPLPEGPAPE